MNRSSLGAGLLMAAASAAHAAPLTMTHQGRLLDALGAPLTGSTNVTFRLHADPDTSAFLFEETLPVTFEDGVYSVQLGLTDDLDNAVFNGTVRYLGVQPEGGGELRPRTPVHSVPYALQANGIAVGTSDPVACTLATAGSLYFNTTLSALRVCSGASWTTTGARPTGATCRQILAADPTASDGVYTLDPDGSGPADAFDTFCDMTGGGWTLLARSEREGLSTAEYAAIREGTFADYGVNGIGSPSPADRVFWLPLDHWHALSSAYPDNVWRIHDTRHDMRLRDVSVGSAATEYVLGYGSTVPTFTTPFSASPNIFVGARFTTIDNDNDVWSGNCAGTNPTPNGGFWYTDCYQHSMAHHTANLYSWRDNASQQVGWIKLWFREN